MVKNILIILTLLFTMGCGEKQTELSPKVQEIKKNISNEEVKNVVTTEFVPAHIANSTIEVVPH